VIAEVLNEPIRGDFPHYGVLWNLSHPDSQAGHQIGHLLKNGHWPSSIHDNALFDIIVLAYSVAGGAI
jgi:hypothetical protein